ncbi:MAG: HAMP domain-containing protein [Patulibacter sp.]|nr:HAMP domain-containing protein [Patulibacter sp.]
MRSGPGGLPAPWRRWPLRARLTALYTALFTASSAVVLVIAYGLMDGHVSRTLPARLADPILDEIALQLVFVLVGTTLLAAAIGWVAARRALRPIHAVTAAARRVSDERLDERLALSGPRDEVRELADTFDAMLERLEASLTAQQRFVANAGHELRTPLTAISTEVDVTLDDPDADVGELRRMGERVLTGTDELNDLLDGLLVLARSQRGVDRRSAVELGATVRRVVDEQPVPDDRHVTIDPLARPVEVWGDPALLQRVIANLVDNGLRYNHADGWVRVTVETSSAPKRCATLRVANSGPVIAPGDVGRLTEPFERLGRHGGGGSGLGLSIVQAVVQAHGGMLSIAAPETGGLVVEVRLPLVG